MFKSLEVGNAVTSQAFDEQSLPLRRQLLEAQFDAAAKDYPIIIVLAGLPGAGKGAATHRLHEWMDTRRIQTNTFWQPSDEEVLRPYFWRFWRALPKKGNIGIFLGSWYTQLAQHCIEGSIDHNASDQDTDTDFTRACNRIIAFEDMLSADGALVIKIWLHISEKDQRQQLQETAAAKQQLPRLTDAPYELLGRYDKTLEVAQSLIESTQSLSNPWHVLESSNRHYRDLRVGNIVLEAMQQRLTNKRAPNSPSTEIKKDGGANHPILNDVDLSRTLKRKKYKKKIAKYQAELQDLAWQCYREERAVVIVFEGWDAAGNGSAIRRATAAIDPRLYDVVQIAAPSEEEHAHHYLWRFWKRLQRNGRITIFDRSWYGRVLVERVEQYAEEDEWQRSYAEIRDFESQLSEHGTIVLKFWLHLSQQEQLDRFKAREKVPHKRYKITADDWRNRDKWDAYMNAVEDMIAKTHTSQNPWTLIPGDSKYYARVKILKTLCKTLRKALGEKSE